MTARSVHWQDGMFMWPHHMQQEERFQSERVRLNHQWNVHHNWGLRELELDSDACKSGRLVIRRLQARLREGTLVEVLAEGRLPILDLNELLVGRDQATVYLAVARNQSGRRQAAVAMSADHAEKIRRPPTGRPSPVATTIENASATTDMVALTTATTLNTRGTVRTLGPPVQAICSS